MVFYMDAVFPVIFLSILSYIYNSVGRRAAWSGLGGTVPLAQAGTAYKKQEYESCGENGGKYGMQYGSVP